MGGHTLLQGIFLTQGSKLHLLCHLHFFLGVSVVAQLVKNPPAMRETWVWSLCWAEPLEEGMATHSSILAWRIPGTEEPGGLQSMGPQRVGHDCMTKHSLLARTHCLPFGRDGPRCVRGETLLTSTQWWVTLVLWEKEFLPSRQEAPYRIDRNVLKTEFHTGDGGNRTGSISKAGLHLGPDCGLWAICSASLEMTYQLENQAPGRKSPLGLSIA